MKINFYKVIVLVFLCIILPLVYFYSQTTIYIIRHAQKVKQPKIVDAPLTEYGLLQADSFGKALALQEKIPIIYVSPMRRAKVTAEIIARHTGSILVFDDRLTEKNYIRSEELYSDGTPKFTKRSFVGKKETKEEHLTRITSFLKNVCGLFDRNIWIVAHGGLSLRLLEHIGKDSDGFKIGYCSIVKFRYNKILKNFTYIGYINDL